MARIAHLTSVHPAFDTRIFTKECRALVLAGHEVILIVPHEESTIIEGVRIVAVPKAKGRLGRMFKTTYRVLREALSQSPDVFHVHDPELLWVALYLRLRGRKVVYDMHENVPRQIQTKHWIPRVLRLPAAALVRIVERAVLPKLHVIFAEKSYVADYLWLRNWTTVLNLPRLEALWEVSEPRHTEKSVVYLGRIHRDRGAEVILDALSILKSKGLEVRCDFIGACESNYRHQLLAKAESNRLSLHLYGFVPATAAWRIVSRCHVGLAVLKPIPNYLESYPTKLFEYMALGLPVVASDFPLYRDVVDRHSCGICVNPARTEAVADAIGLLLTNSELAERMARNGQRAVADNYQWANEEERLLGFYERHVLTNG